MESPGLHQRLINVVLTPSRAFDGFENGVTFKDWLYPMLIVIGVYLLVPQTFRDISFYEAEQRIIKTERAVLNNPDIPEEHLEKFKSRMADAKEKIADAKENPWAFRNLWGVLLLPVVFFVIISVFSLVLLMVGNFGFGGKAKFFQVFTVVTFSYIIGGSGILLNMNPGVGTIELLVKTPMIIAKGSTNIMLSPGLLFDELDSFLKHFVNQFDLFRLWSVAIMGFGFAKLYDRSTAAGIVAVGLPWLIFTAVGAALQSSSGMTIA